MKTWCIIINPTSGNNFVAKRKKKIFQLLKNLDRPFKIFMTQYSGHEAVLVHEGLTNGFRNFISVGGDGTLHHVTNGAIKQDICPVSEITIGVIPVGTGNDWIKNNDIPKKTEKAIEIINKHRTSLLDIGILKWETNLRYFNILTGVGYDGYVVEKVKRYKKFGKSAYIIAAILGFIGYKKSLIKYQFNDQEIVTKSLMGIVGLGKYCGSGMRLTENTNAKDGLFDITLVKDISVFSLFLQVRRLYNGKISRHPKVDTYKTKSINIEVIKGVLPFIEADGELIGQGNFEVEILALGMRFIVG